MTGLKTEWLRLMNMTKIIGDEFPEYIAYQQRLIYTILEDVHSVSSMTELQDAIDSIGTGAGTIFITAGMHIVDIPIDIDGSGSLVIYGHGDNTVLRAVDGVSVFNITDCQSLLIKTLQIDATNYTGATSSVIVNETNNNVISLEDITIVGNNLGIGIELQSNNCIIEHCNISLMQDGIYNASNRNIITQNIVQNNARYGININSLYSSINGNTCNLNLMGIYVITSTNNSISNNICNQNTEHGIYIHSSSYNTLSGNTCENNDSNTANDQAGMFITNNSDFNTISGNSLNNNNNIGGGDGYGLLIATATCEENVVASNNYNGNDIDIHDIGVGTTVEYYVQNVDELQDAINSIGSGAGIININASFNVSATIIIDANGSYLIEGEGDNTVLTTVGDIKCFDIDIARQVVFKNFKINASSLTTVAKEIIDVNENNNNLIVFDNITITGDGTHGYGIELNSNNCRINNCNIDNVSIGINILSTDNMLQGNKTLNCNVNGIQISANNNMLNTNTCSNNVIGIYLDTAHYNQINGNYIEGNTLNGIYLTGSNYNALNDNYCIGNDSNTANPQGGIVIDTDSDFNTVISNTSIDNNNAGAGIGYGILINNADCSKNTIDANKCSGNDIQYWDNGTNTEIEYRCSTAKDIQDAIDSIAAKSGIIEILMGTISVSAQIAINGGGSYTFKGTGASSILQLTAIGTHMFYITDALYVHFVDIKFDMTNHTGYAMPNRKGVIAINEIADNWVLIENCIFYYNGALADAAVPHGVLAWSNNITITNSFFYGLQSANYYDGSFCIISDCLIKCRFGTMFWTSSDHCIASGNSILVPSIGTNNSVGIHVSGAYHNIVGNNISNCGIDGIDLSAASYCLIDSNIIDTITSNLPTNRGGIYLTNNSDYNLISHNIIKGVINAGAGIGYGVVLFAAIEDVNYISHNIIIDCDLNTILDNGTGTLYDKIESVSPIGTIKMFSGVWVDNTTIVGWYKCDGNNGTVNLVDKFIRGGVASGAVGGSDDAIVVEHSHDIKISIGAGGIAPIITIDETTTQEGLTPTEDTGIAGVGKNIPAYYTLIFIQRIS